MLPRGSDLRFNWAVVRLGTIDEAEMRELVLDAWELVVPQKVSGVPRPRPDRVLGAVRARAGPRGLHSVGGRPPSRRRAVSTTDPDRIPLLLIHGAWLSARSWERFADYFDQRGLRRLRAGVAAQARRRRGAARGRRRARRARPDRDRRPLRGADPRARPAARADRPLVRRADRRAAARPRARPRRRRAEPGPAEGHPRAAVLVAEGGVAGARAPVQAGTASSR